MAEETDLSQKTEAPTPKRIEDARRKGQVASSREVNNFMLLAAAALCVALAGPYMAQELTILGKRFLAEAHTLSIGEASIGKAMLESLVGLFLVLAIPFLVFVVAAIASSAVQNSIVWTSEPVTPKLDKISPIAGLKRLFSAKSIAEFIKSLVKICVVGVIGGLVVWAQRDWLLGASEFLPNQVLALTKNLTLRLLGVIAAIVGLIAILDFLYQRSELLKQLRMSRQEIKEEHKESDGDPAIKQRLRQLRTEKARMRMMAEVPQATVVIMNPTHYAVALRYEPGSKPAPEVVAKGMDKLALKIRDVARENNVPVVENPPLARALHANTEIGEMIPESEFKAVAKVISYVMQLRRR